MSVTRHAEAKSRTKKQQMEFYLMSADKYINGARGVARRAIKNVKILRTGLWILAAVCIAEGVALYWRG